MTDTKHLELYKRYRPTRWAGLIGQEKVAKSLQAAVKGKKIPSAYLFAGPRGTGKTSSALLLAKAINCLNPTAAADPCNKCDVCVNIDSGRQLGINYISASNISAGGAEKIREVVQQAKLRQPIEKQVWIIDEIHSLSKQAFDSLLIPLEENTISALFIFCTTEVDRIPQTILSRVQQRRFALVDATLMSKYLTHIVKKENLEISEDIIQDAVRKGRGSVRDTFTALETIMETGEYSLSYSGQLLEALSRHDLAELLTVVAHATKDGQHPRDLAEQLFEDLRNLLLSVSGVDQELVGIVPVSDEKAVAKGFIGKQGIMLAMDDIGEAITQMSMGADARIILEVGSIKAMTQLKKLKKAAANRQA